MRRTFLHRYNRIILTLVLLAAFIWSLFSVQWTGELVHPGGAVTIVQILKALFTPELSPEILTLALVASWRTLAYATAAISIAVVVALVLGILASGVLFTSTAKRNLSIGVFRGLLGFMRAINELVWAWFFVAAVGLSPLAALLALIIPYAGELGRIFAEILQDVPQQPIQALKASGAGKVQQLFYGYLPIAFTDMLSYIMYRYECALRSSAILGFMGLGGLGYQIQLALEDLNYPETWTYVYFLIGLVLLTDLWSNQLRRRLVA